jgi:hypothetical protein
VLYQSFSILVGINNIRMAKFLDSVGPVNAGAIRDLDITAYRKPGGGRGPFPYLKSFMDHKHRMNITSIRIRLVHLEYCGLQDYRFLGRRNDIVFLASLLKINPEFTRVLASSPREGTADLRLVKNGVQLETAVSISPLMLQGQN